MNSYSRAIVAWRGDRGGGGGHGGTRGGGGSSGGGGTASTSSLGLAFGPRYMVSPTLEAPPAVASEGRKVEAEPLAVGIFGSHNETAGRPVCLPVSVPASGSATFYDERVRSGVGTECGLLLPMWHNAVCFLSVDAATYPGMSLY